MKIPKRVKIGEVTYDVNMVNEPVVMSNTLAYGKILFDQCKIDISTNYADQHQYITLWHEIAHGILHHFSIDLENEEEVVDAMARGICMIMRDNPCMFDKD